MVPQTQKTSYNNNKSTKTKEHFQNTNETRNTNQNIPIWKKNLKKQETLPLKNSLSKLEKKSNL